MPYVNLQVTKGATRAEGGDRPGVHGRPGARARQEAREHTHVVIQEIEEEDWGFAGMLTDDYRQRQSEPRTGLTPWSWTGPGLGIRPPRGC